MNITVIGAGNWGTAIALRLNDGGHRVTLVARRMDFALELCSERENKTYLAGFRFPDTLQIACELNPALMEADIVLLACPSFAIRETVKNIKAVLSEARQLEMVLSLAKGIEKESLKLPCQIIGEILPEIPSGILTGPNYANEVARGCFTGMVLASEGDETLVKSIQEGLSSETLRIYRSGDI